MREFVYTGFKLWFILFFSFVLQIINVYAIFGVISEDLYSLNWWVVVFLLIIQTVFIGFLAIFKIEGRKEERNFKEFVAETNMGGESTDPREMQIHEVQEEKKEGKDAKKENVVIDLDNL